MLGVQFFLPNYILVIADVKKIKNSGKVYIVNLLQNSVSKNGFRLGFSGDNYNPYPSITWTDTIHYLCIEP